MEYHLTLLLGALALLNSKTDEGLVGRPRGLPSYRRITEIMHEIAIPDVFRF